MLLTGLLIIYWYLTLGHDAHVSLFHNGIFFCSITMITISAIKHFFFLNHVIKTRTCTINSILIVVTTMFLFLFKVSKLFFPTAEVRKVKGK